MADTQVYFEDVQVGDEIPALKKNCSTQQLVLWAAASGDFYQIHYDQDFAKSTGLPGIIVHGALKNAFLGQLLHEWVGRKGRIIQFGCSYRGMDYPNQDIHCRGVVKAKRQENGQNLVELEIWTENPEGQKTTPGSAVVALPSRG
ncbi:MAG TPA: MaoC/PaaZ C-terminal domain-containing protein [Dehalococcoidia bacterium]